MLVIEYAWRNIDTYKTVLFLAAKSVDFLHNGLAELTGVLPLTDHSQASDEHRIMVVLDWLRTQTEWLLILDGVDTDEVAAAVKDLLPRLSQGHVLITSRLSRWSAGVRALDLGVLALGDATDYLLEATDANRDHTEQDTTYAEQVAIKVGQLALGLEHAAAYVNARYLSFDDYLTQWESNESTILESFDLDLIEYPNELLITWKLSIDQLEDEAKELLDILSWLSPDLVPEHFFQAAPDSANRVVRKAVAELCKYSLANHVKEGHQRGFQVHRLVQSTTRYHQLESVNGQLPMLDKALAWMNDAFQGDPSDVRDWLILDPLADHVNTVCDYGFEHGKTTFYHPTSRLLNELALLYRHKARYAAAERLMRRVLEIDEKNHGVDHPKVARNLDNLAQLLFETNRLSEAEPLMRRALEINEKSLGEDHPNVATDLNNLALLLYETNRLLEAEPLIRRALEIDEKSFGEDHPAVAHRLHNLAGLLNATDRLPEAEPLVRRALLIDEKSYGENHPIVAKHLASLAGLLQATNRLSDAEPLFRRALEINEKSYGDDHPSVATDLNNLAGLLQETDRLSEAERLYRRALAINESSYEDDHPNVADCLHNLAGLLQATDRFSEAEPLALRALSIYERIYGTNHPKVAICLNGLALLLEKTGRLSEAEPLMRRHVEIFHDFKKSSGHEHPHLNAAVNNYVDLLVKSGLSKEQIRERVQKFSE